ncbi:MAG: thymidine kinase [Candidatus Saccharibacteria bacterium]|nr:thymidine kinase [Candidatus Saccharibacteria bacterium]
MAKLHFKYGAMNSGKSDTLIKTAYNYVERGLAIVVVKPSIDTKGDNLIVARAGMTRRVDIIATPKLDIRLAVKKYAKDNAIEHIACVLIDEAQFLTDEQINQLFSIAKEDQTSVIAYGLRADFKTALFPGSKRLLELADNIEKLPTMCRCGNQAEFNCRKVNDQYIFEGEQVAIDGEGSVTYDSLCGTCYLTEKALAASKNTTK